MLHIYKSNHTAIGIIPPGPPELEFFARDGIEDIPVRILMGARPHFYSTSSLDDLYLQVLIPPNSTLNRGVYDRELQLWNVSSADFGTIEVSLPEHSHGTFVITVIAVDPMSEFQTIRSQQFTVLPVADSPLVSVVHDPCVCSGLLSFIITSSLVDTDGSELLEVSVDRLPAGAQLSTGRRLPEGDYIFSSADLSTIITANFSTINNLNSLTMSVRGTARERATGTEASSTFSISVRQCSTGVPPGKLMFNQMVVKLINYSFMLLHFVRA